MTKGLYYYLKQAWRNTDKSRLRELMNSWRNEKRVTRIEKPTRLDKARTIGYKAKKGFVMVRVVIARGGRRKSRINRNRKSKRHAVRKILKMNYRWVAEQRAQRKFTNLEVLNSYFIGKDGNYYYFEVIMIDPKSPEIKSDKTLNWICKNKNKKRALRGLTSSAKKSRGLRKKSHELKIRPSSRANKRKGR